jgi:hypothetical protein
MSLYAEQRAFLTELRNSIPGWVHPAGAATIDIWIRGALAALDDAEFAEVERLVQMVRDKIALEHKWRLENLHWRDRSLP